MERARLRERWRAICSDPLDAPRLAAFAEELDRERCRQVDALADLLDLLATTIALDHVHQFVGRRVRSPLLALLVQAGRLSPDAAVARLDPTYTSGAQVLATLWRRLSPASLRAELERLPWGGTIACDSDELGLMLRRLAGDGDDQRAVDLAAMASEPSRSRLLAALLHDLRGSIRGRACQLVGDRLASLADPFEKVSLLQAVLPALDAGEAVALRAAAGVTGELRAWISPQLAPEWDRLDAIAEPIARSHAWERRIGALGSLASAADTRRWLSALLPLVPKYPEQTLFRLQTGVPPAHWDEVLAAIPAMHVPEARVWLARGQSGSDARPALAAVLASELRGRERVGLLLFLLPLLADPEPAARAILAEPERDGDAELRALVHLPVDEWRDRLPALIADAPFEHVVGGVQRRSSRILDVLARLGAAQDDAGRHTTLALARQLLADEPHPARARELLDLAALMTPDEREELVRAAIAGELEPQQIGELVGHLPADRVDDVLAAPLERALQIADARDRWSAVDDLLRGLPEQQRLARLHALYRPADPDEIRAFPRWALDTDKWRALVARELAAPYRPYTAWLLGYYAHHLPEAERAPVLEQALVEFAAIAAAPTNPGNDAGPFVDMAPLLDLDQVSRALAICDAMAAADWGPDLVYARQYLLLRRAELGDLAGAEAGLLALPHDPDERAWGLGALLGIYLSHGTSWDDPTAVRLRAAGEYVPEDSTDSYGPAFQRIEGVMHGLDAGALAERADVADGLLATLPAIGDPEARSGALGRLFRHFTPALPVARWVAAIAEHTAGQERVVALLDLAELVPPPQAPALVREAAALLAADPSLPLADLEDELFRVAHHLAPADRLALLSRWLRGFPRRESLLRALADDEVGEELIGLLRALAGEAGLAAAARTIAETSLLLARP